MKKYDTLLLCDKILIYKNNKFICESNKALGIKDSKIVYLSDFNKKLKAEKILNLENHLVLPGFVNTHTHLAMSLFRGLADNKSLTVWLEDYIFPLEAKLVKEDFVKAGTKISCIELIRSGITTCCDMYFYNKAIAETLDQSGLRALIGVGIPSVEKDWTKWKQKILDLKESLKNHNRLKPALAPHAPYTVESKILKEIGEFSKKEDLFLTIHVSESQWEQEEIRKRFNKTPVQYLDNLGVTGKNSLFVHCVQVNQKDLQIMAKTQTCLSYNPESNMKLSNGIAPINLALKEGVTVGLGTDSSASNNNLNFFEEMGTGAKLQALKYGDESITAQQTLKMATLEGAKALGLEDQIGTLEVGKRADIIALDLSHSSFHPFYNPISNIVYTALGNEVSFVMCDGKILMEDYKIKSLNEQKILKESHIFSQKVENFIAKKH
ncbi:MAG: amidohydrolase, partial [Bdellovibrionaceae bacterium]|nr:amidohydrolase [Pseudobdellovibrionaceae bacterium]